MHDLARALSKLLNTPYSTDPATLVGVSVTRIGAAAFAVRFPATRFARCASSRRIAVRPFRAHFVVLAIEILDYPRIDPERKGFDAADTGCHWITSSVDKK